MRLTTTRKGYYTIIGPNGEPLKRADGELLRVTSRDECYERITEHGEDGNYTIHSPEREVGLLAASNRISVTPPNNPPEWSATPNPTWTDGVGGTYDLNDDCFDPEGDTLTFSLVGGSWPTGVSMASNGIITATSAVTGGTTSGITVSCDDGTNAPVTSPSFSVTVNSGTWLFGTQQGSDFIAQWENWMATSMPICSAFVIQSYTDTWTLFRAFGGNAYNFERALDLMPVTTPIVVVLAMVAGEVSNRNFNRTVTWDEFAGGDYDAHYTAMANSLKSKLIAHGRDGSGDTIILSLGHEMTGDWYPWSVGNKVTEYKASWNRATAIIKGILPSIRFEFRPAPRKGGTSRNVSYTDMLPSDNVDFLSLSLHDTSSAFTTDFASFESYHLIGASNRYGLNEVATLARSLGKQLSLGEWRPQIVTCSSPYFTQSPNPELFNQYTYEFMDANRDIMGFDLYLDSSCSRLSTRQSHAASIKYKELWSQEIQ